eukprot:15349366-Ditylum_brightwellii.AAC.1
MLPSLIDIDVAEDTFKKVAAKIQETAGPEGMAGQHKASLDILPSSSCRKINCLGQVPWH